MSGFSYPQPIFSSSVYNPSFYLTLAPSGFLSYTYAQTLYLSKYDYRLSYISGVIPGIASAGLALIPSTNLSLSGLGAVSCASLSVGGTGVDPTGLAYLSGVVPGTAAAGKTLIPASDLSINGLGAMTLSSLRIDGSNETFAGGGGAGNITRSNVLWRHTGGRVVLCN